MFTNEQIFPRLKKKFLRETRVDRDSGLESDDSYREVDYRPMQTFLEYVDLHLIRCHYAHAIVCS